MKDVPIEEWHAWQSDRVRIVFPVSRVPEGPATGTGGTKMSNESETDLCNKLSNS